MTKHSKNSKRTQLIFIIIWALILALTLIGVYRYYDKKIEKLEQSIEEPSGILSHRMSERAWEQENKQIHSCDDSYHTPLSRGEKCRRECEAQRAKRGVCFPDDDPGFDMQPYPRLFNTPPPTLKLLQAGLIHSMDAHESVPSRLSRTIICRGDGSIKTN